MRQLSWRLSALIGGLLILTIVGHTFALPIAAQNLDSTASATDVPESTAAATANFAALPPTAPTIQVMLGGRPLVGITGSACWPQPGDQAACNFLDDPRPPTSASATSADSLLITVTPADPAPTAIMVKLLDDADPATGDPMTIDLTAAGGKYDLQTLTPGAHRVEVDVIYDDGASQPFVSYVYLLNVGGAVALNTTATLNATAETGSQETATLAATESAVETGTTSTTVTTVSTQAVATETLASTTAAIGKTATSSLLATTAAPAATLAATTAILATTAIPPTTAIVLPPTATLSVPGTTATATPTLIPTLAETSATASGLTPTNVTSAGLTPTSVAPVLSVVVGGHSFGAIAISTCVTGTDGAQVCIRRPTTSATDRIQASPGTAAQIQFAGPRPLSITVKLLSADGLKLIKQQTITPDNLVLYTLPTTMDTYLLSIQIKWLSGDATYFYRLSIG
jgi:hypothetical protein